MTANCPICRSPVEVDDAKLGAEGVKAQCSLCEEVFLVKPNAAAPPPPAPAKSGQTVSASRDGSGSGSASRRILQEDADGATPRVLVAHDSHAFGDLCRTLLEEEGFDVEVVNDGEAAEKVIADLPPAVAILEAGLPKRFGFQLCADAKKKGDVPTRFLLVASIYDRKRLGRSSETLAVAPDDFVEPRNVELELIPKVKKLLRGRAEGTGSRPATNLAPEPARPVSVAESASSDGIDFGELFEEEAKPAPQNGGGSTASEAIDSILMKEAPVSQPSVSKSDEDELWNKALDEEPAKNEDDDLLQTLMQMAKPSEPSISRSDSSSSLDDVDLPLEDEPAKTGADLDPMAELEKLASGDFDAGPSIGVAPAAGPLEIPSRGPVPDAWKADDDEKAIKGESDEDALNAILDSVDDVGGTKRSQPGAAASSNNLAAASDGGFELGSILEADDFAAKAPDSEAEADPETLMQDGFSDMPSRTDISDRSKKVAPAGVMPGGPPTDVPTVLKGKQQKKDEEVDPVEALLSDEGFGSSSSKPAASDDDEKSLAEVKRSSFEEEDDPLAGLLSAEDANTAPREKPKKAAAPVEGVSVELSRGTGPAGDASLAAEHEKARRLAKLIVGDILLYNADRVTDAVKSGNFFEAMKGDIKDGRDFYDEKVPEAVRNERDYIQEVLEEVIANKKRDLGLA